MPIPADDNGQSVYNMPVGNRGIQISAAQAADGSPVLSDHVRVGAEVLIEYGACPVVVLRPVVPAPFLDNAFSAIAQAARDEGWEHVLSDRANYLDHCLYVCEAL